MMGLEREDSLLHAACAPPVSNVCLRRQQTVPHARTRLLTCCQCQHAVVEGAQPPVASYFLSAYCSMQQGQVQMHGASEQWGQVQTLSSTHCAF